MQAGIWLDLGDVWAVARSGGRFFHGYYRCYCYLAVYLLWRATCDQVQPADRDLPGSRRVASIVGCDPRALAEDARDPLGLLPRRPARPTTMSWAWRATRAGTRVGQRDGNGPRRERTGDGPALWRFRYRTRKSWSCGRVIGKADAGQGESAFCVSNLSTHWCPTAVPAD